MNFTGMNLQQDKLEPNLDFIIPTEILDDLCCRFIINVPSQEKKDLVRICFQIEQAHWFYLDFYSNKFNDTLRPCSLKEFTRNIFYHIHYLRPFIKDLDFIIDDWKEYKYSVPTYGAIILDEESKHILLVKSYWSKSSWGFPKGKINKDETPCHCAAREVFEETGFNISSLVQRDAYVETVINEQRIRLYIVSGVSRKTKFSPQTRNEIKDIKWFPIDAIPIKKTKVKNKLYSTFYMVIPFMRDLRKWILKNGAPTVSKQRRSFKSFSEVEDLLHTTSVEPESNNTIDHEKQCSQTEKDVKPTQQSLNSNADNEVECYEGSDEDDIKQSNEEIYGIPKVKSSCMSGKELDSYLSTCPDISFTNSFHQKNCRSKQNNLDPSLPISYEKELLSKRLNSEDNYVATQSVFISNKSVYQEKHRMTDKFDNSIEKNISSALLDKNTNLENQKNSKNVVFDFSSPLNNVKLKGKVRKNAFKTSPSYSGGKSAYQSNQRITNHLNDPTTFCQNKNEKLKSNELLTAGVNSFVSDFIQRINQNKAIQAMKYFKFNKEILVKSLE